MKVFREEYPIAVRIVARGKTSYRLLATARTIRHIMGMQPKLGLLMHQLNNRTVRNLLKE